MFVFRRGIQIKIIMSFLFLSIAVIPWILPFLKKIAGNISCVHYSKKDSFLIYLFSLLSVCVLSGILIPSMLIGSSPQEFSNIDSYGNPLFFVANTALQTFGLFVFLPLCLYFLFSANLKKIFIQFSIVFLAISLCNIFLFPGNYGIISLELVFNSTVYHYYKEIFFNLIILVLISFVILIVFYKGGSKILLPLIILPLVSLIGVSLIKINHINKEYKTTLDFFAEKQQITSIEPIFNLSKTGKNTVIIMLDRATSGFFPFILEESPDLADVYSGFVYYPNTVSFSAYTRLGAPPLFGGYEYTPKALNKRSDVSMRDKHNEALLLLPKIFSSSGYEVAVTDPPYPNYSFKDDLRIYDQYPEINALITHGTYTDYWLNENNISLPSISDILKRNMFWYSLFKIMPYAFRSGIYQYGGWFSMFSGHKFITNLNAYSVLDYLSRLTGFSNEKENSFVFFVNNTTHSALHYQPPEYRPVLYVTEFANTAYGKENEYHTNIGALKRIGEWLDFLKSENVYDNTRIIIAADHGLQLNHILKTSHPFNLDEVNPLLLFKDFDSQGPVKTDMTFMSNADIPFLAVNNQIEDAVNPWTGNRITNDEKQNPLYIAFSSGVHLEDPDAALILFDKTHDYYIHDNIFNDENWVRAE